MITSMNRKIPYINKPISDADFDEIGMEVYVDYLESAIEQRASMISVVSRFGTGKSSLIELLKRKYNGWEKFGKNKCKRVYCQINLWSQLEEQNPANSDSNARTLELHRTFLYQLIAAVHPKKSSYFSKRTSRNFGMFRISTENSFWNLWINLAVVLFLGAMLGQHFSEQITGSGILGEKVLSIIVLAGYAVCAVIVVLIILRTEIIFSSKNSEGNRQIEENELIDLYRENVLVPKKWYKAILARVLGTKHIVVIIEDLDRTDDGESVYHFLKELRKYYVPYEQAESGFMNQVTFVVNIMPEDLLREKCTNRPENGEYIYDKLFDYSLNLNRINIDNFDAILEALIQEKREEFEKLGIELHDSDNVHDIAGMQWIIYGKSLNLRQVKERLNDAILLYESLRKKFGPEYSDFSKCAVVAYLRNAYSKEFYDLSDCMLEDMLNWYATGLGSEEDFLKEFGENQNENEMDFLKILYDLINNHLIDGNYRIYFFNYPKKSHLFTVQETQVRNLIIYDENLNPDMEEQIKRVQKSRPEVIINALDTVVELAKTLPDAVIYSETIWNIGIDQYLDLLYELLEEYLGNVKDWSKEDYKIIEQVIRYKKGAELLYEVIAENTEDRIAEIREYLLEKHKEQIAEFTGLFRLDACPITIEELEQMEDVPLKVVLDMLPASVDVLSGEVIDKVCERVGRDHSEENLRAAEEFYTNLAEKYAINFVADDIIDYMLLRGILLENLEECIYTGVVEREIPSDRYYRLLNGVQTEEISSVQLERIHNLNEPGNVSMDICMRMKQEQMYADYLQNMILLDASRVELAQNETLEVLNKNGKKIWETYPEVFQKIRNWICTKYKNDAILFEDFFKESYPLITQKELRNINVLETALTLYDAGRIAEDKDGTFVNYCNRQFRPSKEAFRIFQYVGRIDEDVIPEIFYQLDMKKVKFSGMSQAKKLKIVQELRVPLNLATSMEIIHFMDFTECLLPELEKEIADDLKNKDSDYEELRDTYINTINKMGKITSETIKNIMAMPTIRSYSDIINEELYRRKQYTYYVSSKIQAQKAFLVEYDRLEELWSHYLLIMKSANGFKYSRSIMYKNFEFLKMIQDREDYKGLTEESRMAMAQIPQDEGNLEEVLNYGEDFVIRYYSCIAGFQSKRAAEKFVRIMKKYPQYAQNAEIYQWVHGKLVDGNLKRSYTNLFKKANC